MNGSKTKIPKSKQLTYEETLTIVEKFMIDSQTRKYCTDVCKGRCCSGCYKNSPDACHKQEGRRLSCSIFMCFGLLSIFSKKDLHTFTSIDEVIIAQYYKFKSQNPYSSTPPKEFLENSSFDFDAINKLSDRMAKRIKKTITFLTKNNIDIRSFSKRDYIKKKIGA